MQPPVMLSQPPELLLAYMRNRAEGHESKAGGMTVRKGFVGATPRDLSRALSLPLPVVADALQVLRDAGLIDYRLGVDGVPVRIRVTGGREQSFTDSWAAARRASAEANGTAPVDDFADAESVVMPDLGPVILTDGHRVVGMRLPDDDESLDGFREYIPLTPLTGLLDDLPLIRALTNRRTAMLAAATLLEAVGMEELAGEVRVGGEEMTRLEREVLVLVGRVLE